jgi:hypothetical protein
MATMKPQALNPIPLMELATGFWNFKTLAAAVEFSCSPGLQKVEPLP